MARARARRDFLLRSLFALLTSSWSATLIGSGARGTMPATILFIDRIINGYVD